MAKFRSAANVLPGQHNQDRIRRAESWWRRSVETSSDTDKFIFLWIAFNAALRRRGAEAGSCHAIGESEKFPGILRRSRRRDDHNILHELLLNTIQAGSVLLKNHFVYDRFGKWFQEFPSGVLGNPISEREQPGVRA